MNAWRAGRVASRCRLRARAGVGSLGDLMVTASDVPAVGGCPRCRACGRACRSCQQRRRRAWLLVELDGLTVEQAAARMSLSPARLRDLLEAERDRHDLKRFKLDSIPTARVREFIAGAIARDGELDRAEIAARMEMRQSDFDRMFGFAARRGHMQARVGIPAASRLAIALGRAPNELEGC